jgi:hypothetical protein
LSLPDEKATIKVKIKMGVATNTTFIHRLANPELVRKLTFYYLILWIVLGAMDTLFFQVKSPDLVQSYPIFGIQFKNYVVSEGIVTWLKDFIGHLFAFGTVILALMLEVVKSNLSSTSSLVLNKVNDLYRKFFYFLIVPILGLISATIFYNSQYTSKKSSIQLWSNEISTDFLPDFIAANYFIIVMIPLVLGIIHYCLLLHVSIKEFKSFSSYNPFHGDQSFGLLWIGRSIFWGTVSFVIVMLLALILQLSLKNGELTFGVFLGTLLFMTLVWFGAINPLKKLSKKLKKEKGDLYESVKEEVRSKNRLLGSHADLEELNAMKLLLDASRENEKELLKLSVVPITWQELLIGGGIILFLLGMIVYQITL